MLSRRVHAGAHVSGNLRTCGSPRERFRRLAASQRAIAKATKRNLVTPRCLLPRSKQTLDDAYSEQFCNVAPAAVTPRLLL